MHALTRVALLDDRRMADACHTCVLLLCCRLQCSPIVQVCPVWGVLSYLAHMCVPTTVSMDTTTNTKLFLLLSLRSCLPLAGSQPYLPAKK